MGRCELYPQSLQHNANGSFIAVCGDGEYIIYTSRVLRNKAFGSVRATPLCHFSSLFPGYPLSACVVLALIAVSVR